MKIKLLASQIADWIFLIRLTGDMNIVRRRIGKIRSQVADPEATGTRGCSPPCGCNLLSLDSHSSSVGPIPRYRKPLRMQINPQNLCNQKSNFHTYRVYYLFLNLKETRIFLSCFFHIFRCNKDISFIKSRLWV